MHNLIKLVSAKWEQNSRPPIVAAGTLPRLFHAGRFHASRCLKLLTLEQLQEQDTVMVLEHPVCEEASAQEEAGGAQYRSLGAGDGEDAGFTSLGDAEEPRPYGDRLDGEGTGPAADESPLGPDHLSKELRLDALALVGEKRASGIEVGAKWLAPAAVEKAAVEKAAAEKRAAANLAAGKRLTNLLSYAQSMGSVDCAQLRTAIVAAREAQVTDALVTKAEMLLQRKEQVAAQEKLAAEKAAAEKAAAERAAAEKAAAFPGLVEILNSVNLQDKLDAAKAWCKE